MLPFLLGVVVILLLSNMPPVLDQNLIIFVHNIFPSELADSANWPSFMSTGPIGNDIYRKAKGCTEEEVVELQYLAKDDSNIRKGTNPKSSCV
jgi:hypothetical protein